MSAFDPMASNSISAAKIEVYTTAYRVSGTTRTRHARVADILNQLPTGLLIVDDATVTEYAAPSGPMTAPQVLIPAERIVLMATSDATVEARAEMRIPKRAVQAELLAPPFRVLGSVYVPQGSRPIDGLLNAADRFLAMTDVAISCALYPVFAGSFGVIAIQTSMAHLIAVSDDEAPDELLAEVLDETTAHGWLQHNAGNV